MWEAGKHGHVCKWMMDQVGVGVTARPQRLPRARDPRRDLWLRTCTRNSLTRSRAGRNLAFPHRIYDGTTFTVARRGRDGQRQKTKKRQRAKQNRVNCRHAGSFMHRIRTSDENETRACAWTGSAIKPHDHGVMVKVHLMRNDSKVLPKQQENKYRKCLYKKKKEK